MVGPARRRQAIGHILGLGMCSARRACRWFGLSRSALYRPLKSNGELEELLLRRILELSLEHPTYGYRFVTAMLRREGWKISFKKVQRLRRKEGLAAMANTAKKTRRGSSTATPVEAEAVNDVWCWDFIHDVTEDGRSIRILSIVDEYSRFCVELKASRSLKAEDVVKLLKKAIRKYGAPKRIRSDNGPEFVAKAIGTWLKKADISSVYIQPGSPWENPYVESFHSRFRNDCLNREWFLNLLDAKSCIEIFREEYNTIRPHSSLSYRSPIEIYDSEGFASVQASPDPHRSLAITNHPLPMLT
jgi:putative transposase|tara:strand:+ start:222 stop:1127 length:906 start_codon:yes stop_codon:yes gene_type:complete